MANHMETNVLTSLNSLINSPYNEFLTLIRDLHGGCLKTFHGSYLTKEKVAVVEAVFAHAISGSSSCRGWVVWTKSFYAANTIIFDRCDIVIVWTFLCSQNASSLLWP
jgi:hypothetical protein